MSQDPKRFEIEDPHYVPAQEHELMYSGSRSEISLKSLMFQTGYLTIDSFDSDKEEYILKLPNQEIEKSLKITLDESMQRTKTNFAHKSREKLYSALNKKDVDRFVATLNTFFYSRPYSLSFGNDERSYHSFLHMILQSTGFVMESEPMDNNSRPYMVIDTDKLIYIIECKFNQSGDIALSQIKKHKQYEKYTFRNKEIVLLGINFHGTTRGINSWQYEVYTKHLVD